MQYAGLAIDVKSVETAVQSTALPHKLPFAHHVGDLITAVLLRSPFIIEVEDTQRDLIDPAVKGTRNVLAAAAKAKTSVKRVVLTSSVAGVPPSPSGPM